MSMRAMRVIRGVVLAVAVALALAACSSSEPDAGPAPSVGEDAGTTGANGGTELQRNWIATTIDGKPAPEGIMPTILFAGGEASGLNGCNQWGASYEITEDGGLMFGEVRSTLMACEGDGSQTEAAFSEAIAQTHSYKVADGTLTLSNEAGDAVMELEDAT